MARYQMEDGTIIDTNNATKWWNEDRTFDGRNLIGRSSNSQWHDQTLYRSRKGRYYIEFSSRVQGERDRCEWVSPQRAAAWLLLNGEELPDDLKQLEEQVSE
jgi:hypothetical protein